MFDASFVTGYNIPFCQVWLASRSGKPMVLGDSIAGVGIFKKNDAAESFFTSVNIKMEAKKPNEATISIIDNVGILDAGIQPGIECFIKMGYTSTIGKVKSKIMMVGVLQAPTVNFNDDGTITLSINVRDKTDKLRYEKKTRSFQRMPRIAIIMQILAPYIGGIVFTKPIVMFKSMAQLENKVDQIRMTDLEFLYFLASKWGCTFDTRVDSVTNGLTSYFVDDSSEGDHQIGLTDVTKMGQTVYVMEWRKGLRNVKSLKFSGETSEKNQETGFLKEGQDGKITEVKPGLVSAADPNDPSNWEMDPAKMEKWRKEHPGSSTEDLKKLWFTTPQPQLHKMFFKKKAVLSMGTPPVPISPDSAFPGLGATGVKCDFELIRGDINLEPNMPIQLGGDIYGRFKSEPLGANLVSNVLATKSEMTVKKGSVLYWRTVTVDHTFSSSGYETKGTLKR